jgi:hypothetical protein
MTNLESKMGNRLFSDNDDNSNNQNELSGEDSLKLLVGEGCKYASVEELAKAAVNGQNHIATLEKEATTFKDIQAKQTSIDDILAAIKADGNNANNTDDNQTPADQQKPGSEPVDIAKTVEEALARQNSANSAQANTKLVSDTLSKALGDRVSTVYSKVGNDLGVDLDELSKTSPEAVIRLVVGQGQPNQNQSHLPGGRFDRDSTDLSGELTRSKINELYAKGGMTREAKFKLEHEQAAKLGSKFFN